MNYSDIQHRFANKLEGKNGRISAGNVRYEGRNFYSYSTVFGQWLDISKNVVAIFDGSTSNSSSKHKLGKWCFPDDVHVFPLDFGSNSYYGWRNCNLVGEYWSKGDECFKEYHRMKMIDHYVERIYNQIAAINGGKRKGLENVDFSAWGYIEELCSLYKDTSVAKWLKYSSEKEEREVSRYTDKKLYAKEIAKIRATAKQQRKLAKLLKDGERDVHTLTDALFGEGTFKKYWDYCGRYRKTEDKKNKIIALCNRLGIEHHYERWQGDGKMKNNLSAADIRKLTAKERNEIHFKALAYKERKDNEKAYLDKVRRNKMNAYRWITGYEQEQERWGSSLKNEVRKCRNKYSGREYSLPSEHIFGFYWCDKNVKFSYESFVDAEDKEAWIRNFYEKCELVEKNAKAISVLKSLGADIKPKEKSYDDDQYILDRKIIHAGLDAETLAIVEDFIARQDKHFADEEARKRAEKIARLKREEEKRKEKEYMEQVKQEQIDECLMRGVEGCRDLWRKHLQAIDTARLNAPDTDDAFFYHGNVLLRLNLNKDKVETSKYIKIPVETCKKMWKIVSKWHENPSCFKPVEIDTKGSGRYTISSYQNDILTAGCHKIAYTEMERMYNEIIAAV